LQQTTKQLKRVGQHAPPKEPQPSLDSSRAKAALEQARALAKSRESKGKTTL